MLETASVAMAVYNGERFLEQQIDSILEQCPSGRTMDRALRPAPRGAALLIKLFTFK